MLENLSRSDSICEERMSGVRGVLNYADCFAMSSGSADRGNGWEAGLRDGLAPFTTFRSSLQFWAEQKPYQAVIQPERMLSVVHL